MFSSAHHQHIRSTPQPAAEGCVPSYLASSVLHTPLPVRQPLHCMWFCLWLPLFGTPNSPSHPSCTVSTPAADPSRTQPPTFMLKWRNPFCTALFLPRRFFAGRPDLQPGAPHESDGSARNTTRNTKRTTWVSPFEPGPQQQQQQPALGPEVVYRRVQRSWQHGRGSASQSRAWLQVPQVWEPGCGDASDASVLVGRAFLAPGSHRLLLRQPSSYRYASCAGQ